MCLCVGVHLCPAESARRHALPERKGRNASSVLAASELGRDKKWVPALRAKGYADHISTLAGCAITFVLRHVLAIGQLLRYAG